MYLFYVFIYNYCLHLTQAPIAAWGVRKREQNVKFKMWEEHPQRGKNNTRDCKTKLTEIRTRVTEVNQGHRGERQGKKPRSKKEDHGAIPIDHI